MPLTSSSNAFVFRFFSQLLSLWPFETETVSTVSTLNAAIHEVSRSLTKSPCVSRQALEHHLIIGMPTHLGNLAILEASNKENNPRSSLSTLALIPLVQAFILTETWLTSTKTVTLQVVRQQVWSAQSNRFVLQAPFTWTYLHCIYVYIYNYIYM